MEIRQYNLKRTFLITIIVSGLMSCHDKELIVLQLLDVDSRTDAEYLKVNDTYGAIKKTTATKSVKIEPKSEFGTKQLGVVSADTDGRAMVIDSQNNVFVTGTTTGGLDGHKLSGTQDLFLVKYSANGSKRWTRQLGAISAETVARGIAVDHDNNIYVTGSTNGGLDGKKLSGSWDCFIVKYNLSGKKLWSKLQGITTAETRCHGISSDKLGNIYVTGFTSGSLNGNTLQGDTDFFISKYNSKGTLVWSKQYGVASQITMANAIAVDKSGNVIVTGGTMGGLGGNKIKGVNDMFIVKHNSEGIHKWTQQFGVTAEISEGLAITTDRQGNSFVTGNTTVVPKGHKWSSTISLFVSKHSSSGKKLWMQLVDGGGDSETYGYSIVADSNSNTFITGFANSSIIKNTEINGSEFFVLKYDSAGKKLWANQPGIKYKTKQVNKASYISHFAGATVGNGIALDSFDRVFVTGNTAGGLRGNKINGISDSFVTQYFLE